MRHTVRLSFTDGHEEQISCLSGEDVVSAALRGGFILMSECREGACSSCKCYLADGEYDNLLPHSTYALSEREEDEGFVLACRLQPRSDLELEFDYPFSRVHRFEETVRRGRIDHIEMISDTVARLVVRTLRAQEPLDYLPGQFVRLTLGDGTSRDFSMANPPCDERHLEFFVRLHPEGRFSRYLGTHARAGEILTVEGPRGTFVLREHDLKPVFIAAGTGLAPILAMLRQLAVEDAQRDALLLFGNTNPGDVFGVEQLRELEEQMPRLRTHIGVAHPDQAWTGESGLITEIAERVLDGVGGREYYYCGPPEMIEATSRLLDRCGVPREHRHHETFTPEGAGRDG